MKGGQLEKNEIIYTEDFAIIIVDNNYKEKNKVIIDLDMVEEVKKHKWSSYVIRDLNYVGTHISGKHILLNRFIYGIKAEKGMELVYRNRNSLDNRRENIIEVSRAISAQNMRIPKNNTSGVKGVAWNYRRNQWWVYITSNGIRHHLGCFSKLEDAKQAREEGEKTFHTKNQ